MSAGIRDLSAVHVAPAHGVRTGDVMTLYGGEVLIPVRVVVDEVSRRRLRRMIADPPPPNAKLRAAFKRHAREVDSR